MDKKEWEEYEKIYEDNPNKVEMDKFTKLLQKQETSFLNFMVKQEPDEHGWSGFTRLKFIGYSKGLNYLKLLFEDTKETEPE